MTVQRGMIKSLLHNYTYPLLGNFLPVAEVALNICANRFPLVTSSQVASNVQLFANLYL